MKGIEDVSPLRVPARARNPLEDWTDRLAAFEQVPLAVVRDLREKIVAQTFDLVVAGQFKRGKSSVINALLGTDLLPVGVVPLTSVVTILSFGETVSVNVVFEDGRHTAIAAGQLADYVTERGNSQNAKCVAEVRIACPVEWLRSGIRLIDTPGVGSIYRHNTDIALEFLPKADAVLLVLSVEQPLSAEERHFLDFIGEHAGKTFFLLNKTDLLETTDLRESFDFTAHAIREAIGRDVSLFAVSARMAQKPDSAANSGILELRHALDDFLQRERGTVLRNSITRRLRRLAAQTRVGIELECRTLTTPLDDLVQKIHRFEKEKRKIRIAREDSALLLGKESVCIWMERLDRKLAKLRADLQRSVSANLEKLIAASAPLSTRRLSVLLEHSAIEDIRAGFDAWRTAQDSRLTQDFAAWCARHARQIDDSVDELFRFSSELFDIDYEAVRIESTWKVKSGFYYKFWSEPPSLRQLANALVLVMPRGIGHRVLRKHILVSVQESIETQSGRVRYDFLQRLEASVRDFRHELMERIDDAVDGIEAAINNGAKLRKVGEQASSERLAKLRADLDAIARIEAEISHGDGEPSLDYLSDPQEPDRADQLDMRRSGAS